MKTSRYYQTMFCVFLPVMRWFNRTTIYVFRSFSFTWRAESLNTCIASLRCLFVVIMVISISLATDTSSVNTFTMSMLI